MSDETTTLYVRNMPREAVRLLKSQAALSGLTMAQYLAYIIHRMEQLS